MPTGNEFDAVYFGKQEQSYKSTERESRSGDFDVQGECSIAGPGKPVSAGNYPRTLDPVTGSEPHAGDYYIDNVFSRIPATGPDSSYKQNEQQSIGGEFGPVRGQREGGRVTQGDNELPQPVRSKQFSSDVTGDPEALCQQTKPGITEHADMLYSFGLCSPVAGLGDHGWLRDSLTNTGQKQPGNESPHYTAQIARRISEKQGED